MKLRVAAIIAVVLLVGALVAFLWDFRDKPGVGIPQPVKAGGLPQAMVKEEPVARPSEPLPTSVADVSREARPPEAKPAAVAAMERPRQNFPPTPTPRASNTPLPADLPSPPVNAGPPLGAPDASGMAKGAIDLDKVSLMLRDYRTRMGENPTGTNAEIMKAVMGGNPKKAQLGPPEGQQVNGNGELVDRWGTPYFFHQVSKSDMEIRSAGPDQKMWTDDDVTGR